MARFACTLALGAGCAGSIGEPSGATTPDDPKREPPVSTPGAPLPVPTAPVDPKTCAAPTARIWKLTPEQYTRTVQALLGTTSLRPGDELANTLAARKHGFSNEAAALDMSEPHVGALLESSRKLAALVLADAKLWTCGAMPAEPCVRGFVETFGARAFRRPLTTAELDTYTGFFRKEAATHDPATAARLLTTALFMSPSFVFRTELGSDTKPGQTVTLTAHEKASALSYFLTDGPPDAELANAARAGQLETREQLAAHARRLVGSATLAQGVTRFLNEHLETQAVKLARKDAKVYADWKAELQGDMAKEGELFVQQVTWKEDGKLDTLLTGGFSMLNSRLAAFYGVTGPAAATTFEKVMLPPTRGGFLTQAGLMSTLSRENDTDPVMRGRFVREVLLCQPPPAPPPDVNAVPPPPDGKSTQRERLANHSKDPTCATCHRLLDPLGLAFEHYDGIGKYRLMDVGRPIDATGTLIAAQPEGARYANAVELMTVLAKSPDVRGCFVAKTYQWAHGRAPTEADACALHALAKRFGESGGAITDLMVGVVSDDSFFTRRAP